MNLDMNTLFDNSYCLTINHDRYLRLCNVFTYHNLKTPREYIGYTCSNISKTRVKSCYFQNLQNACFGHISIINMCRYTGKKMCCIFEDDAYPVKDIVNKLSYYLKDIPDDCNVLKFGDCMLYPKNNKYTLINCFPCFGAHAYLIFNIDLFLNTFNSVANSNIDWLWTNIPNSYTIKDNIFFQYEYNTSEVNVHKGFKQVADNDFVKYEDIQK